MNSASNLLSPELSQELRTLRRDFHRHPEQGWLENRTSSLIARKLHDLHFDEVLLGRDVCLGQARMGLPSPEVMDAHYRWAQDHGADSEFLPPTKDGYTGVIGILHCGPGPTVCLRFDLDALAVREETDSAHFPAQAGFSSCLPGTMHACGHDTHMTIGLGAATLLAARRQSLHGTLLFLFQPAEEGLRGARSIVLHGHLDHVDYLLGSHIMPSPTGKAFVSPGLYGFLASTKINADFLGTAAHAGASPEKGNNALLAAATAILNLHAISRHSAGSSRINVGTLLAQNSRNVICDHAHMELEVRGETTEINTYMKESALRILHAAADLQACRLDTSFAGSAPAMPSSPELESRLRRLFRQCPDLSLGDPLFMGGSEDFSYLASRVIDRGGQACFSALAVPCRGDLHSSHFSPDEEVLDLGVTMYVRAVLELMKAN